MPWMTRFALVTAAVGVAVTAALHPVTVPQRLHLDGVERSFLEFGDHGDRLVMRAVARPALVHWLSHLTDTNR
jgi:hypothetical protein